VGHIAWRWSAFCRIFSQTLRSFETETRARAHPRFLVNTLGVIQGLQIFIETEVCYGNGFMLVYMPFNGYLTFRKCGSSSRLRRFTTIQSSISVAADAVRREMYVDMRRVKVTISLTICKDRLKLKLWNVHEIELLHDPFSHDTHYIWRIRKTTSGDQSRVFVLS